MVKRSGIDSRPEPDNGELGVPRDRLVSVESQREFDLFSGEWAERVFVKLYVAARTSGLLAAISDRDWKTLCTLATYMDGDGFCFPSQAELARAMGCSRQMANERIKNLAEFRFQDQPVLVVVKSDRHQSGKWTRNGYRVLGLSSLRIYEGLEENDSPKDTASFADTTMSSSLDTVGDKPATVSSRTVTVELDTNKKQLTKPEFENSSNVRIASPSLKTSIPENERDDAVRSELSGAVVMPLGEALAVREAHRTVDLSSRGQNGSVTERPRATARRRRQEDPSYQLLQQFMRDIGREFNDRAPLEASATRAVNIWQRAGIDIETFIDHLYTARTIVKERTGTIRSSGQNTAAGFPVKFGMGYYFAVVEDLCGLRVERDEMIAEGN